MSTMSHGFAMLLTVGQVPDDSRWTLHILV